MEAVGQLTGGVAHDFNNLLVIILGNLETLLRQLEQGPIDASRIRRASENALRGAQRAASLTQRLLAFARRQPLEPKPVDVNRLVSNMSEPLRRTLGSDHDRNGTRRRLGPRTDPNQLESAILNLAVNSRDAMRRPAASSRSRRRMHTSIADTRITTPKLPRASTCCSRSPTTALA
jgi:signal transduction histidine kinase